jgi:hypothetical protein
MNKNSKRIIEENKNYLECYWDYRDELSDAQIKKILFTEDGLCDVETEIWENSIDYIDEQIAEILDKEKVEDSEEREELRLEMEGLWDINIKGLMRNSRVRLRATLLTNEDFIYMPDIKHSETLAHFKRVFKGLYKKAELDNEIANNMGTDYNHFVFFFSVSGENILKLAEQLRQKKITLTPDINFGLFNFWVGAGSVLEMSLKKPITLDMKDWTGTSSPYYEVRVQLDKEQYGIQETYGLVGEAWKELEVKA